MRRAPYAPRRGARERCGDRRHLDDLQGRAGVIEYMDPARCTARGPRFFTGGLNESDKVCREVRCFLPPLTTKSPTTHYQSNRPKRHRLSRGLYLSPPVSPQARVPHPAAVFSPVLAKSCAAGTRRHHRAQPGARTERNICVRPERKVAADAADSRPHEARARRACRAA